MFAETPTLLAEVSSSPTARVVRPSRVRYSQRSSAMARATTPRNEYGTNPQLAVMASTNEALMSPSGVGRSISVIPCKTLSVAIVAMIDGIDSHRIRTKFTQSH